jgi:hypothetical protein
MNARITNKAIPSSVLGISGGASVSTNYKVGKFLKAMALVKSKYSSCSKV